MFIVEKYRTEAWLVAHELKHVAQYESCDGFDGFLRKYLSEVNLYGYLEAPMEQEAIAFASSSFPWNEHISHTLKRMTVYTIVKTD